MLATLAKIHSKKENWAAENVRRMSRLLYFRKVVLSASKNDEKTGKVKSKQVKLKGVRFGRRVCAVNFATYRFFFAIVTCCWKRTSADRLFRSLGDLDS